MMTIKYLYSTIKWVFLNVFSVSHHCCLKAPEASKGQRGLESAKKRHMCVLQEQLLSSSLSAPTPPPALSEGQENAETTYKTAKYKQTEYIPVPEFILEILPNLNLGGF